MGGPKDKSVTTHTNEELPEAEREAAVGGRIGLASRLNRGA